jgi:GT2 family glycosyltransferase
MVCDADLLLNKHGVYTALHHLDESSILIPHDRCVNVDRNFIIGNSDPFSTGYANHVAPSSRFNGFIVGAFLVSKQAVDRIGLFNTAFVGWGGEDNELESRYAANGVRTVRVGCPCIHIDHTMDPEYFNNEQYAKNASLINTACR